MEALKCIYNYNRKRRDLLGDGVKWENNIQRDVQNYVLDVWAEFVTRGNEIPFQAYVGTIMNLWDVANFFIR
jgi:hypothetical protein